MIRHAFTMIEVLCGVMILSLGITAAIGMVLYGLRQAEVSIGRTTGMATAMSVAVDPTPLLGDDPLWTPATPGTTTGYLNGYWVERTEDAPTVVATSVSAAGTTTVTTANVKVDVREAVQGRLIASYNQRLVKQSP